MVRRTYAENRASKFLGYLETPRHDVLDGAFRSEILLTLTLGWIGPKDRYDINPQDTLHIVSMMRRANARVAVQRRQGARPQGARRSAPELLNDWHARLSVAFVALIFHNTDSNARTMPVRTRIRVDRPELEKQLRW